MIDLDISGTAVRDLATAIDVHLADSLAGLDLSEFQRARLVVDLGSGAGFPGLPLAIARPDTTFVLVDSVRKKIDAVCQFVDTLGLENVECVWGRAEELSSAGTNYRERCDVVTARALAPLAVLLEYASPLLRLGDADDTGFLVAWKGETEGAELTAAEAAAPLLGMTIEKSIDSTPYPESKNRQFVLAKKVAQCPDRFPRRPGVAVRRPLA